MDIRSLNDKLKDLINNINSTQNVLDKTNCENKNLNDKIRELERQCANFKNENTNLNNNILKERSIRCQKEKENQCLTDNINDTDLNISDLNDKYNTITSLFKQVSEESKSLQVKNDNLKEHIMLLTQQNQKLLGELEKTRDQDFRIKNLLERKNQSTIILRGVQSSIGQNNGIIQKIENESMNSSNSRENSPSHYRSISPTYIYERRDKF